MLIVTKHFSVINVRLESYQMNFTHANAIAIKKLTIAFSIGVYSKCVSFLIPISTKFSFNLVRKISKNRSIKFSGTRQEIIELQFHFDKLKRSSCEPD